VDTLDDHHDELHPAEPDDHGPKPRACPFVVDLRIADVDDRADDQLRDGDRNGDPTAGAAVRQQRLISARYSPRLVQWLFSCAS
jgi:hypothetical protein